MKKIILLSALACIQTAFATITGPYVGVGGGYGIYKTPSIIFVPQTSRHRGGLSGRAFTGFNISPYFGIEAGYAVYATSQYKDATTASTLSYYPTAADGVLKAYLPLGCYPFNIYALGGLAFVRERIKFTDNGVITSDSFADPPDGSSRVNKSRPIYGAGINFTPNPHFATNFEYTIIQKLGNPTTNAKAIPYLNLATLNVAYYFG